MANVLFDPYSLAGIAARSFVLLIVTAAIALAARHRSAAILHAIWTGGLAACLALPVVILLVPNWSLPLLPRRQTAVTPPPRAASPLRLTSSPAQPTTQSLQHPHQLNQAPRKFAQPTITDASTTPHPPTHASPSSPATTARDFTWLSWWNIAAAVWAAGALAVVLRLLRHIAAARRRLNQAHVVDDGDWRHQRDVAARRLGLRRRVHLVWRPGIFSPMVVGAFRSVLLLPGDAFTWSHDRRQQVLLHELAHVKRRDVFTQTLATLACAAYWFNPLAWWAAGQMKRLREIACDDVVLAHATIPANYAQTLLDVAKHHRAQSLPHAVAMYRSSNVERRIIAILSATRSRAMLTPRALATCAAVALLVAAVVGTCQLTSRADDPKQPLSESPAKPEEPAAATNEPNESRTMLVRILDEAGQPLPDAELHTGIWEIDGAKDYPNRDYTADEHGHIEVAIPRRLKILRLWPSKEGFVTQFINFGQGTHEQGRLIPDEFEFRLHKAVRLSGRILDAQGKPIPNAKVRVRVDVDEPTENPKHTPIISTWLTATDSSDDVPLTDADGRWSIANAPAPPHDGRQDYEFRLQVTHPDYVGDTRWGELQAQQGITTAQLRSGDATLTLQRGAALSGQVTGPDGQPVTKGLVVWSDRPYWATGINETQINDSGHYQTKHLAPGTYPITVIAPGFAPWQQSVELSQPTDKRNIQLAAGNPIHIRFVDRDDNPIPKVGVRIDRWRGTEALYNYKHSNVPLSGIPRKSDDQGVYRWDWAPSDAVTYSVGAQGYAERQLALVAKPEPHVVVLQPTRLVAGTVTDARTGTPIERFQAMPVIVFREDFYHTRRVDSVAGQRGEYELPLRGSGDPTDDYRVRFEAPGYRSLLSDQSFGPHDGRAVLDVALEPALARAGKVVDTAGRPLEDALIVEASPSLVPDTSNGVPGTYDAQVIRTDAGGNFSLLATSEPALVRAYHDAGFAEKRLSSDEESVGVLKLQPWATVSGRLFQADQPVFDQTIFFTPLITPTLTDARFQDSFQTKTDAEGRFHFDRLPPDSGTLRALLGPWRDSPLTSSESIPLQLSPGDHHDVTLGADGATISGTVVATGRKNEDLSKQWSLNYLISRDRQVEHPVPSVAAAFPATGRIQPAWLRHPDFNSWLPTRRNHFVKLAADGGLTIHGVQPGDYDFVIQLYEQPAGCLVETIGEKVVPVTVTEDLAESGRVDLGRIEVACRIGPRVGSDMRAFNFTDATGRGRLIDDMHGRYVLLHVWASWCAPCLESMPALEASVRTHADSPITFVGLNVDEDLSTAKSTAAAHSMDWAQNYLGPESDLMRQLAVSSVPAYYLIGPDGKLVRSANTWTEIRNLLDSEL